MLTFARANNLLKISKFSYSKNYRKKDDFNLLIRKKLPTFVKK